MANLLDMPKRTVIGENARASVGSEAAYLGWKRVLLVSDQFHDASGRVGEIVSILTDAHVAVSTFCRVDSEPDTTVVDSGLEQYRDEQCDGVVALGGGSPLDAAKTIAVLAHHDVKVPQLMGLHKVPQTGEAGGPGGGIIAIPSTAGTGAEATKVVVITDATNDVKMMCLDRTFLPAVAIVDYELSMTMPKPLTAAVGVDALTHAIEAYVSKKANVFTDPIALHAIKLISRSMRRAFSEPDDRDARSDMMVGAFQGGVAFSNASVCLVHGMSRPIGACFHVPHGLSNAMLLPAVTKFSVSAAPARYATVARAMGCGKADMPDSECCQLLVDELIQLNRDLNMQTPKTFGIDGEEYHNLIDKMAGDALASGSPANNPVEPSAQQIMDIYREVYA